MVYLAELLVVIKIVRIHAQNVHHIHRHKCLDNDAYHISLALGKRQHCVLDALGCRPSCWNTKNSSWDNVHVWPL